MIATASRMAPYNPEAEAGFVASVLQDPTILDRLPAGFRADHLFRESHRIIFDAAAAIRGRGGEVDTLTVDDEIRRDPALYRRAGGLDGIIAAQSAAAHAANWAHYAEIVRSHGVRREGIRIATELLESCYAADEVAESPIERAATSLVTLAGSGAGESVATLAEVAAEYRAMMDRRRSGEVEGLATGFPLLDRKIGGLAAPRVVILAARPAQGKTGLAMNIAATIAKEGARGLVVSQEMGRLELFERMVSGEGRIDNVKLRDFAYLDERTADSTWRAMEGAVGNLAPLPLMIDDTPGRTAGQVESVARRLHAARGLDFAIVDYVQLLEAEPGGRESRQEAVAKISRRMKRLAMSLRIPIVLLAQLNRETERREDKRPRMSDLRESGALEQDADQVILIHRPEYYDLADRPGEADLIIGKNRWGPTGTVSVNFNGPTTTFTPLAPQEDY